MEQTDMQRYEAEEGNAAENAQPEGAAEGQPSFQELISGAYRQDYENAVGQRIQAAIQQRFRHQQDYKKQWESAQPVMRVLGARYGLDESDAAGIAARLTREEGSGQESAPDSPRPESDYLSAHIQRVTQQAESLRAEFPGFDLETEMRNPAFARLTAPGVGLSVRDAFLAVHSRELQADSMRYAAQQAGQRIAASVMAGAGRPKENGMDHPAAAPMTVDVLGMDRQTRAEYRRRIHNGEKINFKEQL